MCLRFNNLRPKGECEAGIPAPWPCLEESGGLLRAGAVETNTLEEVGRLQEALRGVV